MLSKLRPYMKSILAVVGTIFSAVVGVLTDGHITDSEWIQVAILGVGAAAVFAAPNVPGARHTKSVLAGLAAALSLLTGLITDGLSAQEILLVAIAALTAAGVLGVPNVGGQRILGDPPNFHGDAGDGGPAAAPYGVAP